MIPVAAINAAVYGHRHNHNEKCSELDGKYFEKLEKLNEKSNLILEYLKKTFKADNVTKNEEFDINNTIYSLRFYYLNVGIRLSNKMIINADIDWLYKYSYDLVFSELVKNTKERWVNNLESKGE